MKKHLTLFLLLAVALAGCNFTGTAGRTALDTPTAGLPAATATATTLPPTPTVAPSPLPPTATPTAGPTATSSIFPVLTLAANTVCRAGPAKLYNAVSSVSKGKSFEANGRNADGSWVALQAPRVGDDCWVPLSSLDNPPDLGALSVVETQPLPGQPMNVIASANACGSVTNLWLYWTTVNAVGYRIFRNGTEIGTVYGSKFRDLTTPRTKLPTVFLYEIQAFNASGVSDRASVSVTICD